MSFFSILRKPDSVIGATENTPFRFEESKQEVCPVKYDYVIEHGVGKLVVYPSGSPIKYLKLRFRGELNFVDKVFLYSSIVLGSLTTFCSFIWGVL